MHHLAGIREADQQNGMPACAGVTMHDIEVSASLGVGRGEAAPGLRTLWRECMTSLHGVVINGALTGHTTPVALELPRVVIPYAVYAWTLCQCSRGVFQIKFQCTRLFERHPDDKAAEAASP